MLHCLLTWSYQLTDRNMALAPMSSLPVEFLRWNQEVVLALFSGGQCWWAAQACLVQNFDPSWNRSLGNIMGIRII